MPHRRKLLATAAALLILAAPLPLQAADARWRKAAREVATPLGWTAGDLDGRPLYGENGQRLGEVEAVLVTETGVVAGVAVEVGDGVLGIGGRDVLLRFDQLRRQGDRLTTLLSEAQLNAQPPWDD